MVEKLEYKGASQYKAQINMWLSTIERLNNALITTSNLFINIRYEAYFRAEPTLLLSLIGGLNEIYRIFRAKLYTQVQQEWDKKFTELWLKGEGVTNLNKIYKMNGNDQLINIPREFFYELNTAYNGLCELIHELGLDIPTEKIQKSTTLLKGVLR